ncbi:MAG: HDIG domain-containing protein [Caldilineaceae bacterium SB0662_bin_9]|uniref:HDIG domain-containing protein n=1 Tax=Caldilineaceae bacterium SB0662_bin_9 TaxID=2605258 RepID=A0A6B1DYR3_9CHLR|nr:HDIG domain-containing protein [Caldilineaceae bacterium SB0662_bin_9]
MNIPAGGLVRRPAHLVSLVVLALGLTSVVALEIPGVTRFKVETGGTLPVRIVAPFDLVLGEGSPSDGARAGEPDLRSYLDAVSVHRQSGSQPATSPAGYSQLQKALLPELLAMSDDAWSALRHALDEALQLVDTETQVPQDLAGYRDHLYRQLNRLPPGQADIAFSLLLPVISERAAAGAFGSGATVAVPGMPLDSVQVAALRRLDLVWTGWITPRFLFLFPVVVGLLFLLYRVIPETNQYLVQQPRELKALVLLIAAGLLVVRLQAHLAPWLRYMIPLAALGMTVRALAGFRVASMVMLVFLIVCGFVPRMTLPHMVFLAMTVATGLVALRQTHRIGDFVKAGVWVAILASLLIVPGWLQKSPGLPELSGSAGNWLETGPAFFARGPFLMGLAAVVHGLTASSLALGAIYGLGDATGRVTSFRLAELARPDHPLLAALREETPGTYQHSLLVSDMAEKAAHAIGADPLLTRVGALYHDIGKLQNPGMFVENMGPDDNPHQDLSPRESAEIIIRHVADGVRMGKEHNLPPRILDFIREHHADQIMVPFFHRALEEAGTDVQVGEKPFRYAGPKPQTRETTVLFLADSCEAAFRAMRPETEDAVQELVSGQFEARLLDGSLIDSPLRLAEFQTVRRIVGAMLQSVNHRRVPYPISDEGWAPPSTLSAKTISAAPPHTQVQM